MEQRIGFLDLGAGRIAYALVGEGPPLVFPTGWFTHLEMDWRDPSFRAFVEALAKNHTVIRYDRLGTGISDRRRPPETLTLDAELDAFGALIDHLGLERSTLFGVSYGGCVAVPFAARNPERVERMVLYGCYANGAGIAPPEVHQSILSLIRSHWGLGSRMLAAATFIPDGDPALTRRLTAYQREAASPEMAAAMYELVIQADVREQATAVRSPTLVLHRRDDHAIPSRLGRELAALVPSAEFVELEGRWHQPWYGDTAAVLAETRRFLGIPDPGPLRSGGERNGVPEQLSERECEVLRLVAEGLSDGEIAERLVLSPHTVHRHVANVRTKLRQPSRAAAAAHATRTGLI